MEYGYARASTNSDKQDIGRQKRELVAIGIKEHKLYDSGEVPESFMMEQMGHTDISCLKKHYYYNRMNDEEKRQILNQVKAL